MQTPAQTVRQLRTFVTGLYGARRVQLARAVWLHQEVAYLLSHSLHSAVHSGHTYSDGVRGTSTQSSW